MSGRRTPWLAWAAVGGVIAAVVAGLLVLGSPAEERARRLDERRVRDLQAIRSGVELFHERHDSLPGSIASLAGEPGVVISVNDPGGGPDYEYQVMDSLAFELCATFDTETERMSGFPATDVFVHGTGRQCFPLEIDPDEAER